MRNLAPIPSLTLGASLLVLAAGCGLREGRVTAQWTSAKGPVHLSAPATAEWCPGSKTILLQGTEVDRVVGLVWHYDSLAAGSVLLAPPQPPESTAVPASAALRYLGDGLILGYRSVSGLLRVTAVDTARIDARVDATLQRAGGPDTTRLSATFRRVPLMRDTTLCGR